jgi:hypothetical protein
VPPGVPVRVGVLVFVVFLLRHGPHHLWTIS